MYSRVTLWGPVHENRNEYLPGIGIPFFQDWVSEHFGIYVPESEVKVRFEREQPVETEDAEISVDFRVMTFRGKQISAEAYPSETIPLEGSGYDPDYVREAVLEDESDDDDEWKDYGEDDENDEEIDDED